MGIGDVFGVKMLKLELKGDYPEMKDLYEKIKDTEFEAGKPELFKNGFAWIIIFPQIDRNNQVQILGSKGKYYVERSSQPAGVGKMAMNMALDKLSGGWTGMSGVIGDSKKKCLELVTKTAETINTMGI